jgi:hypothetical protein
MRLNLFMIFLLFTILLDTVVRYILVFKLTLRVNGEVNSTLFDHLPLWFHVLWRLPPALMAITISVNINNWVFYYISIVKKIDGKNNKFEI